MIKSANTVPAACWPIIGFLLTCPAHRALRGTIAGTLWPDQNEDAARHCLATTLWRFKGTLGTRSGPIVPTGDMIAPDQGIWADALAFQIRAQGVESNGVAPPIAMRHRRRAALRLYRGDYLYGHDADWLALERERLRCLYLVTLYYARTTGLRREVMQGIVFLPLLFPPIITGLALLMSFRELDISRGFFTIVTGHVILIVPVAYCVILVRLQSLKPSLIEASLDLEASQLQTYRHVLWPHLRTAIISAALLSFVLSFDETLVTLFLSGSEMTLPIRLWAMVRLGFVPEVNALATLILVAAAATTLIVAVLQKREKVL